MNNYRKFDGGLVLLSCMTSALFVNSLLQVTFYLEIRMNEKLLFRE